MIFHTLAVTDLETNCYLLSRDGKGVLVVDAGGEPERIIEWLGGHGLVPEWIVVTHGHGDHIGANRSLRGKYPGVKIAIGEGDAGCLTSAMKNMSPLMGKWITGPAADLILHDGDVFPFQDLEFRVLAIAGHTPGGVCLYAELPEGEPPILFSGDTLFAGGIGRSDLPGGSADALVRGIRDKLLVLPGRTRVYPGHGPATTIAEELDNNPWV